MTRTSLSPRARPIRSSFTVKPANSHSTVRPSLLHPPTLTELSSARIQDTPQLFTLGKDTLWHSWLNISFSLCVQLFSFRRQHSCSRPAEYLIVLTGRTLVGRFMGHDVYRATEFDILPLGAVSAHLPSHPVEAHLLALVRSHLEGGNFLFSYTWDLTRRLQVQWPSREADARRYMWEVASIPTPHAWLNADLSPSSTRGSSGTGVVLLCALR